MSKISITPELALKIMKNDMLAFLAIYTIRRRNMDRGLKYAELMTSGKWKDTSNPLLFDEVGCIYDGSHRLPAIFLSGKTHSFEVGNNTVESIEALNKFYLDSLPGLLDKFEIPFEKFISDHCPDKKDILLPAILGQKVDPDFKVREYHSIHFETFQ